MTLINANTLREQSDAARRAIDDEKHAETIKIADRIARMVRKQVEHLIRRAAEKGERNTQFILGIDIAESNRCTGLVAQAYKIITGSKIEHKWAKILKTPYEPETTVAYIQAVWETEVRKLLEDLASNEYTVSVSRQENPFLESQIAEPTPTNMVSNITIIEW